MPAIYDIAIGAGSTSIIAAVDWKTLGTPVYIKNESDEIISITISGADILELDPGQPQNILPGQIVTGTAVGGAALLQLYQGIIPSDESAAKAAATAANLIGTEVVVNATGAAAIAATTASTKRFKLRSVTCHLSAAPTTSEALTVTLDALDGAAYDTVLRSWDLSLQPTADFYFEPDGDVLYEAGDQIVVAYANTDVGTYGLRIVIEEF